MGKFSLFLSLTIAQRIQDARCLTFGYEAFGFSSVYPLGAYFEKLDRTGGVE